MRHYCLTSWQVKKKRKSLQWISQQSLRAEGQPQLSRWVKNFAFAGFCTLKSGSSILPALAVHLDLTQYVSSNTLQSDAVRMLLVVLLSTTSATVHILGGQFPCLPRVSEELSKIFLLNVPSIFHPNLL